MSIPEREAQALRRFLPILSRIATEQERRDIALKIEQRISGDDKTLMPFAFRHLAALFYPSNEARAEAFANTMRNARSSGTLTSRIPGNHGIFLADLAIWPDCPPLPAESPLQYWLPGIPPEQEPDAKANARGEDASKSETTSQPRELKSFKWWAELPESEHYVRWKDVPGTVARLQHPNSPLVQQTTEAAVRKDLRQWLFSGRIFARNPYEGYLPIEGNLPADGAVLDRADLERFLASCGIGLRIARSPLFDAGRDGGVWYLREHFLDLLGGRAIEEAFPWHQDRPDGLYVRPLHELPPNSDLTIPHSLPWLRWTPAGEHIPALPYPFRASHLAAFMVCGEGTEIARNWPLEDLVNPSALEAGKLTNAPLAVEALTLAQRWIAEAEKRFPGPYGDNDWDVDDKAIALRADWLLSQTDYAPEGVRVVGWYNIQLNANFWFQRKVVSPKDAALLLCRHDPIEPAAAEDAERTTAEDVRPPVTPNEYRLLRRAFEDHLTQHPEGMGLRGWLSVAKAQGLRYHPWIDEYLAGMPGHVKNASVKEAAREVPDAAVSPNQGKWLELVTPFVATTLAERSCSSAKELFLALELTAGSDDSPFERGQGQHRGKLFVRQTMQPVSLKTFQNHWRSWQMAARRK